MDFFFELAYANITIRHCSIVSKYKWGHFDILASCKTDYHCKVQETLFIQELQPALNVNIISEKLLLY